MKEPGAVASYPYFEVGGTHYAIGVEIGKECCWEIDQRLNRWPEYERFRESAAGGGKSIYDGLLAAATGYCPEGIEELQGMADGAGVAFEDLFLLMCRAEFGDLSDPAGCTTVLARGKDGRILVAHNEDGGPPHIGLLYVLRVEPDGEPAFLSLTYAGQIPGNGPSFNEHGIIVVTNNINTPRPRMGIPRYAVTRRLMQARSVDEAIAAFATPGRAFGFHYTIVSRSEQRAVGIEVTPDAYHVTEIGDRYVHANHYVTDAFRDDEQIERRPNTVIRHQTAERLLANVPSPANLSDLGAIIASHEESPHTICAHPGEEMKRATLGSALMDTSGRVMRIYSGMPCHGDFSDYVL